MNVFELQENLRGLKGSLRADEGLLFGDGHRPVRRIVVCWMATVAAIEHARRVGADVMLVHEALFQPYPLAGREVPRGHLSWPVNASRIERLSRYELSVIRLHSTLDELCILDDYATALELGSPAVVEGQVKLYDIPQTTVDELVSRVKHRFTLDHVRVTDMDLSRPVRRVGVPWGGLALFVNVEFMQRILRHKPDVLIGGETDSYGLFFAIDSGVPLIEVGHEVSENPGLRNFAGALRERLNGVQVEFFENTRPWVCR